MSIFIDGDTRLVVQGITGRDGSFHTRQMIEYGTSVVAGVTPGTTVVIEPPEDLADGHHIKATS
jgi:succinyl-CoA synthetase alpha subunit